MSSTQERLKMISYSNVQQFRHLYTVTVLAMIWYHSCNTGSQHMHIQPYYTVSRKKVPPYRCL